VFKKRKLAVEGKGLFKRKSDELRALATMSGVLFPKKKGENRRTGAVTKGPCEKNEIFPLERVPIRISRGEADNLKERVSIKWKGKTLHNRTRTH